MARLRGTPAGVPGTFRPAGPSERTALIMTAGSKSYADFQDEHTLVAVKIWCRREDLSAVREFAAQLQRRGTTSASGREAGQHSGESWADISRRALLMAQSYREVEAKQTAKQEARRKKPQRRTMTERFKSLLDPQPAPLRERTVSPIPRLINNDPSQLRRVIQYHHPDKGHPDSDARLFYKAKEALARLRTKRS